MLGGPGPKTDVKGAQSDPNYVSRLLARSECLPGGAKIIDTPLAYRCNCRILPSTETTQAKPLNRTRDEWVRPDQNLDGRRTPGSTTGNWLATMICWWHLALYKFVLRDGRTHINYAASTKQRSTESACSMTYTVTIYTQRELTHRIHGHDSFAILGRYNLA